MASMPGGGKYLGGIFDPNAIVQQIDIAKAFALGVLKKLVEAKILPQFEVLALFGENMKPPAILGGKLPGLVKGQGQGK